MKKLMITCAALIAAFTAAQAADVTSANIVGTQTITIKGTAAGNSGYNLIGISWEAIGGDTIPLQTLFSADDLAKMQAGTIAAAQKSVADRIMIWNPATDSYTTYFLRKQANGTIMGWANYNGNAVDENATIAKGSAFWFYRQAATDISVSLAGEVADDSAYSHAIMGTEAGNSGYNMIAAGFPRDLYLNTTQFGWTTGTAGTIAAAQKSVADRIMIWNPATDSYTSYFLRKQANGTIMGWANYNGNAVEADAKIPAGAAAWYYRQSQSDITVSEATPIAAE